MHYYRNHHKHEIQKLIDASTARMIGVMVLIIAFKSLFDFIVAVS